MIGLDLLQEVGTLIFANLMFHIDSKNICHKLGYNGFKRWHRFATRNDAEILKKIECHIVEYFDELPVFTNSYIKAVPKTLQEHLVSWYNREFAKFLRLNEIKGLLQTNKLFVEAELVQCIIEDVLCEVKKIKRIQLDFSNVAYNAHHISIVDKNIHRKYKKKEKKQGYEIE